MVQRRLDRNKLCTWLRAGRRARLSLLQVGRPSFEWASIRTRARRSRVYAACTRAERNILESFRFPSYVLLRLSARRSWKFWREVSKLRQLSKLLSGDVPIALDPKRIRHPRKNPSIVASSNFPSRASFNFQLPRLCCSERSATAFSGHLVRWENEAGACTTRSLWAVKLLSAKGSFTNE